MAWCDSDTGKVACDKHMSEANQREAMRDGACGGEWGIDYQAWVALLEAYKIPNFIGDDI